MLNLDYIDKVYLAASIKNLRVESHKKIDKIITIRKTGGFALV